MAPRLQNYMIRSEAYRCKQKRMEDQYTREVMLYHHERQIRTANKGRREQFLRSNSISRDWVAELNDNTKRMYNYRRGQKLRALSPKDQTFNTLSSRSRQPPAAVKIIFQDNLFNNDQPFEIIEPEDGMTVTDNECLNSSISNANSTLLQTNNKPKVVMPNTARVNRKTPVTIVMPPNQQKASHFHRKTTVTSTQTEFSNQEYETQSDSAYSCKENENSKQRFNFKIIFDNQRNENSNKQKDGRNEDNSDKGKSGNESDENKNPNESMKDKSEEYTDEDKNEKYSDKDEKDTNEDKNEKDSEDDKSEKDPDDNKDEKDTDEDKNEKDSDEDKNEKDSDDSKNDKDLEEDENEKDSDEDKSEKDSDEDKDEKGPDEDKSEDSYESKNDNGLDEDKSEKGTSDHQKIVNKSDTSNNNDGTNDFSSVYQSDFLSLKSDFEIDDDHKSDKENSENIFEYNDDDDDDAF